MEEDVKNMSKEELLEYLEDISQQLDNIALDQIQFAISELQFFKEEYKKLEEENKELELEKESYKHDYFDIYERTKRYIKEEDVIDLQEKIHKDLDKNGITRAYQIIIDKYFNKLLGDD